jgi:hypothetical protein
MTSKGSKKLNQRLRNVIHDIQKKINNDNDNNNNITLGIYNDHDLQPCELSIDGRHNTKSLLSRINLLSNVLNCFYGART